jgi:DNA primase
MSTDVEKIKEKIDLVDYISRTIQLKRTGVNFMGICPFHKESTPSFSVSSQRQVWHCFGCGKGGDLIKFVMEKQGLDFLGALTMLAQEAGVTLEKKSGEKDQSNRERIYQTLEAAAKYYQQVLTMPTGKTALAYLIKIRGLNKEVITQFMLGYAPDSWNQTSTELIKRGFSNTDLYDAGLVIPRGDKNPSDSEQLAKSGSYDRFRGRITFPIHDALSKVAGFSARTMEKNPQQAKYVNSPETSIYKKNQILYGLPFARETITKLNYSIITEGQLDVISLHQFGIRNAVAPLGTALTTNQLTHLQRLSNRILLLLDQDSAGVNATVKAIGEGLKLGLEIKVAEISNAKDPDEAVHKNANQLKDDLKKSRSCLDYLLSLAKKNSTIENFPLIATELILPLLKDIPEPVKQEIYLQQLASHTHISLESLIKQMKKIRSYDPAVTPPILNPQKSSSAKSKPTRVQTLWRELVAVLLQYSATTTLDAGEITLLETIIPPEGSTKPTLSLARKIIDQVRTQVLLTADILDPILTEEERMIADLLTLKDVESLISTKDAFSKNLKNLVHNLAEDQIHQEIRKISTSSDSSGKIDNKQALLKELTEKLRKLHTSRHAKT